MNNYLINPLSQRIDNNAPHPAQVLLAAHLLCALSDDTEHRVTESQGRGGARQGKTHQRFQNPKESGEANCTAQRFLVFTVKLESGGKNNEFMITSHLSDSSPRDCYGKAAGSGTKLEFP